LAAEAVSLREPHRSEAVSKESEDGEKAATKKFTGPAAVHR
jgi:hypothetical protein